MAIMAVFSRIDRGAWRRGLGAIALAAMASFAPSVAEAAGASAAVATDQTEVRLLSARDGVGSGELALGLHFRMKPGWKVYWRSPGAAGFPPRLDWSGSVNLDAPAMRWPAPRRFAVLGFDTLGYLDEVVFPIAARAEPGRPATIRLSVDYLTCDEICIPYSAQFALDLPAGGGAPTAHAPLIADYAARVPTAPPDAMVLGAVALGSAGRQTLEVSLAGAFSTPDLFVEGPDWAGFGAPAVARTAGGAILKLPVETVAGEARGLAGETLTFTLVDGAGAVEWRAAVLPGPVPETGWAVLAGIAAAALLGGLILNLMPCVLPVLALKLMGAVGAGDRGAVRRRFLATAAGILVSFAILAGAVVAAKAAGQSVGWGLQFQSPVFLGAMAAVLVLFACNLWGVFSVSLPGRLADGALAATSGDSLRAHVLTGMFATLLATPCTAPFVGTAVGFALARGAGEVALVFGAMGVGLASPYLAVAALPGLARALPRPGRWMGVLRAVLGLALAGTAAWLLSLLASQRGAVVALALAGALVLLGVSLWRARGARWAAGALVALVVVGGPYLAPRQAPAAASSAIAWQAFAPGEIPKLVAEGKTVFVDVTADWCLTCKVNARTVLEREEIALRLNDPSVVAMRADWTNPDPMIAAFLGRFGRAGIPFNVIHGPGAPAGHVLPELLTREAVILGLEKARRAP